MAPQKTAAKRITPEFRAQAGKGRPRGVKNKIGQEIKEMVIEALDKAGGVDYLVEQAGKNPVAFMGLVGKIIPLQVNANHTIQHDALILEERRAYAAEMQARIH